MPTVEAAGTTFSYHEAGSGDHALLLMHGYLGCSAIWNEMVPRMSSRYRCVSVDARGVGGSGRPAVGYTIDRWVEDIVAIADALDLRSFGYVGHSMGGLVGYQLALAHPERLNSLVLVCPAPAGPPRAGRAAFAAFRRAWAADDAGAMAALLAATSVRLDDASLTELRAQNAIAAAQGHVDGLLDDVADLDLRLRLGSLQTPTLLVLGAADPALHAGLEAFRLLPNATLEVMSGVGHVPPIERPAAFAEVVERFLTDGVITSSTLRKAAAAAA